MKKYKLIHTIQIVHFGFAKRFDLEQYRALLNKLSERIKYEKRLKKLFEGAHVSKTFTKQAQQLSQCYKFVREVLEMKRTVKQINEAEKTF